ncbi:MAG: hypothetical protein RBT34_14510 [Anaerolineaceae bacterium]|jgi:hypothetical protein|nr:hypothetical protein [Anaerolineaceae bacterium]
MGFVRRVGEFFMLLGFICVAIYFITEPERGGLGLLTAGVGSTALGLILRVKSRRQPEESARFVSLRKLSQRSKKEREKRLAKRKEKEERNNDRIRDD